MANIKEREVWEDHIYQIETSDPVLGGENGIANRQATQLGARTKYLKNEVEKRAPTNSPAFTGAPTAPTPEQSANNQQIATTAFVKAVVAALVDSSLVALDTLNELAAALGNDPNFSRTILNRLAQMQTSLEGKANTATTLAGYGIGDFKVQNYADRNLNNYRTDGVYCFGSVYNVSNAPGQSSGNLQVITGGVGNERWCHQIFYRHYSVEVYRRWQIANDNDDWSPWIRVDAGDWVAMRNRPLDVVTNLGDRDLNTIVTPGFYGQRLNDNVTIARNYPEAAQAGTLLVGPSAYGVQQEYTTFYSYNKYVRNQHHNGWGEWRRIDGQDCVKKTGDTMTGDLTVPYLQVRRNHAWANITSLTHEASGLDFGVRGSPHPQCSIECVDVGNYSTDLRFYTTPRGANYLTSRRHHAATISPDGGVWTKEYGWLHDAFARYAKHSFYPSHYNGAEIWKIPIGNGNCLMITTMNVSPNSSYSELHLPEHYTGWASPTAIDVGTGRHRLGISMIEGSKVKVYSESNTTMHIHVIGFGQF